MVNLYSVEIVDVKLFISVNVGVCAGV